MAVYIFMEVRIKDREKYGRYIESLSQIVANFNGRWLAYDAGVTPFLTGMKQERRQPQRVFLLEFPTMVHLRRCFACPDHQRVLELNSEAAETRALIIQGTSHSE